MKKNKTICFAVKIIVVIVIVTSLMLCLRFLKYRELIGEYELVQGEEKDKLKIGLYNWSKGKKEYLECNLWNCKGYSSGKYEIKNKKIVFHYNNGSSRYEYKITKDNNKKYLTFTDGDYIEKYMKIK